MPRDNDSEAYRILPTNEDLQYKARTKSNRGMIAAMLEG